MPVVIPLEECIARPDDGSHSHPLAEHLVAVAHGWGDPEGDLKERMRFLGGLLHDAGKAQSRWQAYIRERDPRRKRELRVPHAFLGSMLVCMYAHHLIGASGLKGRERSEHLVEMMWIARDVADHHSVLGDIGLDEDPPWWYAWQSDALSSSDVAGLNALVCRWVPSDYPAWMGDARRVEEFCSDLRRMWKRWAVQELAPILREGKRDPRAMAGRCIRGSTGRFIAADRFHSSGLSHVRMDVATARSGLETLSELCTRKARKAESEGAGEIAGKRGRVQETASRLYTEHPDEVFYELNVPTGLGKTLAALRVGLESVARGNTRRVVYVAPYLAILSQAARDVREATGTEVLEHHHLATNTQEQMDDLGYLAMESWQSPIVATTFNQLFRALFPRRAQQTLRIPALERAFLIVDEPQILDHRVWNLFLTSLEAMARANSMQVLLVTATLPTTEHGLDSIPRSLSASVEQPPRYTVGAASGVWSEEDVAWELESVASGGLRAVAILNTIADAVLVYRRLDGDAARFNVHGLMCPVHKAWVLRQIWATLEQREPVAVASTQVLEAGVDLSFQRMFRARPILPSVVQAAGRANRNASEDLARVTVFDFARGGEQPTREYIYRDRDQREVSDQVLAPGVCLTETELRSAVSDYYTEVFARNRHVTACQKLAEAAAGKWSELGGTEPFGAEYKRVPIFVPLDTAMLDGTGTKLVQSFGVSTPEELYGLYVDDRWLARLTFTQRKRFMGLLQNFVVQVPEKVAEAIRLESYGKAILRCKHLEQYSQETGFGDLLVECGAGATESAEFL